MWFLTCNERVNWDVHTGGKRLYHFWSTLTFPVLFCLKSKYCYWMILLCWRSVDLHFFASYFILTCWNFFMKCSHISSPTKLKKKEKKFLKIFYLDKHDVGRWRWDKVWQWHASAGPSKTINHPPSPIICSILSSIQTFLNITALLA